MHSKSNGTQEPCKNNRNSSMQILREAQDAFAGEAEKLGLEDDEDVMAMIKELREKDVE